MDENRIAGTAKNTGGKAQESFGRVTDDAKTQAEGIANQVSGATQDPLRKSPRRGRRRSQCHEQGGPRHRLFFRKSPAQYY
jgi:uncharacterized protein YjbJ (UPF0337 family)